MKRAPLFWTLRRSRTGPLRLFAVTREYPNRWMGAGVRGGLASAHPLDCIGRFATRDLAEKALKAAQAVDAEYQPTITRLQARLTTLSQTHRLALDRAAQAVTEYIKRVPTA